MCAFAPVRIEAVMSTAPATAATPITSQPTRLDPARFAPAIAALDALANSHAHLTAGHGHLAEGRPREAAVCYRAALDGEPATRVSALLGLSLVARRSGQLPQALRMAQAALEIDATSPVAWACYASLLHGVGLVQDAHSAYLRALALPATEAAAFLPALTGLGELMLSARSPSAAIACFRRALALRPDSPAALHGLGTALALRNDFEPALACFRAAIQHMPAHTESHFAAGYCAAKLCRHAEAIADYERAIRLRPSFAPAWGNMAVCLVADGRDYLAVPCFQQALAADPRLLSALLNFGNLLRARKAFAQARLFYERALAVDPSCTDVLVALAYLELEGSAEASRFAAAERWLQKAAESAPEHPEVANARGILDLARHNATRAPEQLEAALAAFARAAALGHKTADSNAGNALLRVGRIEEAVAAHRRSVALDPLHPGARYNLALSQLRAGLYAEGWSNYEARLDFREVHPHPRRFQQPRWNAEPLSKPHNRLFVYYEQGLGDTLQFARFLPFAAACGAELIVEVQPPLVRLLRPVVESLGGQCIAAGESIPTFDCHCPLLSLPHLFRTTLQSIPAPLALVAEPAPLPKTSPRDANDLGPAEPPAIGLCWAGNPRYAADRERSTRLETLLPLLVDFPSLRWVALQKGEAALEIATARALLPSGFPLLDACSQERDLANTAAVIASLDLVLSTDTVIAHLAASIGKPCWLLLPWQSDWRWMQSIPTTPWYPTMCLFRQPAPGDWASVLASVRGELRAWICTSSTPGHIRS